MGFVFLMGSACPAPTPSGPKDSGVGVLTDGGTPVSRADFLAAAGRCAVKDATAFQTAATAFAATPSPETWRAAMTAWQKAEGLQFGPTASSTRPGGMDFRDQIYSWPLISRCSVDETLINGAYSNGAANLLINRKGLAAAEMLLFTEPASVTCGNTTAWAALSAGDQQARKQAYAAAVARDVKAQADALVAAWQPFVQTLSSAGPGNATYPTSLSAVNAVSDAVFYLDYEVKDLKLAGAIGLRNCAAAPCLDQLESQYAHVNTASVQANLIAVRQLLEGCDDDAFNGVGFDDLLEAQGHPEMAARLRQATVTAQLKLDVLAGVDLSVALVNEPQKVRDFYDALKGITDLMKTEFVTVLGLELPAGLEGDND